MGLFSLFRKNKQESASDQGKFLSRAAGESAATRSRSANSRKSSKAGKDESADPILPEKKRARRRLIGAVALVLAVIIILPMILDSEPRPLAGDITIQIPSKDGKGAGTAPGSTDNKEAKPAVAEPKEEIVDPATLAPVSDNPAIATGASAMPPGPVNPMMAPPPAAVPAPVDKQEAPKAPAKADVTAQEKVLKPEPKAEVKAPLKPSERKDEHKKDSAREAAKPPEKVSKDGDSERAMAILEGKPAAGGKFVIQVAALATQEKIDELRGKLSDAGIKSFTQKVATTAGDRTRIRVGPFASRDEAEKARVKINKLGLNATIVPA